MKRLLGVLALAASLSTPAMAAPPGNVEGTVLSLEGKDVIVDVGAPRGLVEGDLLELWRSIELVHPVTRKAVRDRYRIGFLKVVQVRDRLTVAVARGELQREPRVGDTVLLRREPETKPAAVASPTAKPAEPSPKTSAAPPSDADAARVSALFESVKEAPLTDRIRAYVDFVRKYPKSPYSPILHEDAVQYHRLLRAELDAAKNPRARAEQARDREESAPSEHPPGSVSVTDFEAPTVSLPGRPFEIGFRISGPVSGVVLHVRGPSDVGYRPIPMKAASSGHFHVAIPPELMKPPEVLYFAESVDTAGHATAIVGTEDAPLKLDVLRGVEKASTTLQRRTTAAGLVDFADFNTLQKKNNDRTLQIEGQLGMRFVDIGVRALRSGFGVYRGYGGSLYELDELKLEPRNVGLTYGYLEGEFGIIKRASIVARAVCGLTEEGVSGGAMAMIRIGSDLETNLAIGGEFLGGIGSRSITQLEIREIHRVPILLRTEVSNQPAGTLTGLRPGSSQLAGDLGLRTIVQFGYELTPGFVVSLRASAQGRTIHHYGFGGGGAVSYSW